MCHTGLCDNPEHFSKEDHEVNMERAHCKACASKCLGHNLKIIFSCTNLPWWMVTITFEGILMIKSCGRC